LNNSTAGLVLLAEVESASAPAPPLAEQHCAGSRMEMAQKACAGIPSDMMRQACITDVCLTGNSSAAHGIAEAELLEERVNARGISVFVGHGSCVDTEGKRFRTLRTRNVRSKLGCESFLRSLRVTRGVLGAQLRVEGTCEIVVDLHADIDSMVAGVAPPGGSWAEDVADEVAVAELSAEDYVAGVMDDLSWSCWRLN